MKLHFFSIAFGLVLIGLISACKDGELDPNKPGLLVPLTVEHDPSLPAIEVNGTRLHAEAFGHPDSALLIVLHGGPGSDYRYLLRCKAFAEQGYRVIFYDQRGAGLSKRHPASDFTINVMFDDLEAVIKYYRKSPNQKVFLLGHSWGGMLAAGFINNKTLPISGVIVGEPGGFTYDQMTEYVSRSRSFGLLSEALNDATYVDQLLSGSEDDHQILDYKFTLWASSGDDEESPIGNTGPLPEWRGGYVSFNALFGIAQRDGFDWTANLHQYQTPILFIYSERNTAYGLEHAKKVSSAFPNVQLFRCAGEGHDMLSFDQGWNNCFPTMLNYLNQLK